MTTALVGCTILLTKGLHMHCRYENDAAYDPLCRVKKLEVHADDFPDEVLLASIFGVLSTGGTIVSEPVEGRNAEFEVTPGTFEPEGEWDQKTGSIREADGAECEFGYLDEEGFE